MFTKGGGPYKYQIQSNVMKNLIISPNYSLCIYVAVEHQTSEGLH